jgi:exosortase
MNSLASETSVSVGTTSAAISWINWRVLLLVGASLVPFASVLRGLAGDWYKDPNYSHGIFVPLLSGYLAWNRRDELARVAIKPSFHGLLIVVGAIGLLFLGSLGAELFLTRIAIIGTIAGLIVYFAGWKMLRTLAFPIAFLLLMVPLPTLIHNEIVFPLQLLASRFASAVLDFLNFFPVVREGNILVLPHSRLEVVEACSGIRSLMSLITLALGYGYLAENSRWIRFVLAVAIVPVAVVSNGLRVVGTAFATYYLGPKAADGFLHSFSGWVIFLVATTLLLTVHAAMNLICRDRTNSR